MSVKSREYVISGIVKQKQILDKMIDQLEDCQNIQATDYHYIETTAKTVEKNLKSLRKYAVNELVKDLFLKQHLLN